MIIHSRDSQTPDMTGECASYGIDAAAILMRTMNAPNADKILSHVEPNVSILFLVFISSQDVDSGCI